MYARRHVLLAAALLTAMSALGCNALTPRSRLLGLLDEVRISLETSTQNEEILVHRVHDERGRVERALNGMPAASSSTAPQVLEQALDGFLAIHLALDAFAALQYGDLAALDAAC